MTRLLYPDNVPDEVNFIGKKLATAFSYQQALQDEHNRVGNPYGAQANPLYAEAKKKRDVGDEAEADSLERRAKVILAPFREWLKTWYDLRADTVIADINELKDASKAFEVQLRGQIDLETIPTGPEVIPI